MRALLILLLAGAASPALAQHGGHSAESPPAAASCTPEHAAMGHCTMPAQPPAPPPQPACTPEHAAMGHCTLPPEHEPRDPHAAHPAATEAPPPKAPPPADALTGPEHAADTVYDPRRMAASREEMRREHGSLPAYRVLLERAEMRFRDGRDFYLLDGQAWYGGDINKVWFKAEVEGTWGADPEAAEVQALWSHAIDPWFDLQAGVRYDPAPQPDRAHLVLGVQGLAPYWWEIDGALFLSSKGDVTARLEAEHDVRITQKLIVQPRAQIDLSLQDIRELAIGAGLSEAALGLRLRYQLSPLFAPYVGVEYERALGRTATFRRAEGDDAGGWNLLAGIRFWF